MKGDFSRQTFDPARHYSTVRMQQGRVQLDADWNEQADLALYRAEAEAAALLGGCGGPLGGAAFGIALSAGDLSPEEREWLKANDPDFAFEAGDFVLGAGRYFVDGVLCECEHPVRYRRQPDLPDPGAVEVEKGGSAIVYLDVWQRHLTWLDDPALRETALGGADTATRTKTVWQVRALPLKKAASCGEEPAAYRDAIAPSSGRLRARAKRAAADSEPCLVPESAGYGGLENQLYRVEIHAPGAALDLAAADASVAIARSGPDQVVYEGGKWAVGDAVEIFRAPGSDPMQGWLATVAGNEAKSKTLTLGAALPDLDAGEALRMRPVAATYKWSRDNGSIVAPVSAVDGREVTVASFGPDEAHRLEVGHWVELVDAAAELEGRPGFLSQVAALDAAARVVTLRATPLGLSKEGLKLRHWEGVGAAKVKPAGAAEPFAELEAGVQVAFSDGEYRCGDHWLIPARTATADARSGTIEWPKEGDDPVALPPRGIEHRYCMLGILESDGKKLSLADDCRTLFPPLSELDTLVYVGGDGQEAPPGEPLPQRLEAGVFRGPIPVKGARVRFTAEKGGVLAADHASLPLGGEKLEAMTGADGIAACAWEPAADPKRPSQRVEARLLDADGKVGAPTLRYGAQLNSPPPHGDDGCCRRVEPGESIDEILSKLVEEGQKSICLCLGVGSYRLGDLRLKPLGEPGVDRMELTVKIQGAGFLTSLQAEGAVSFQFLALFELEDLDLFLFGGEPLRLEDCDSVAIHNCRVIRDERDPGLACAIKSQQIRLDRSLIDSRDLDRGEMPGLIVEGFETLIDCCEVGGPLVLGGPNPVSGAEDEELDRLQDRLLESQDVDLLSTLTVRNSRITRIAPDRKVLGGLMNGKERALRSLDLAGCSVRHLGNLLVAKHVTVTACGFELEGTIAGLAATTAIVASSWGEEKTEIRIAAHRATGSANLLTLFDVRSGEEIP